MCVREECAKFVFNSSLSQVRASFLEIYQEEVRDLLSKDPKNKLELKEDADKGVYVKDLTSYMVKGVSEMENVLLAGKCLGLPTLCRQSMILAGPLIQLSLELGLRVFGGVSKNK